MANEDAVCRISGAFIVISLIDGVDFLIRIQRGDDLRCFLVNCIVKRIKILKRGRAFTLLKFVIKGNGKTRFKHRNLRRSGINEVIFA